MSQISRYDAVTLADKNRYVVTHIVETKGTQYYCMVGDNNSRILIGRQVEVEGKMSIETLSDEKEIKEILKQLFASF